MQIIKILILILFINVSLEAKYCIQVFTMHKSKLKFLIRKAKSSRYSDFNSVRVETSGKYLVFRIGDYAKYRDAKGDVANIRTTTRDAYVKKCNLLRKNILFMRNENSEDIFEEPTYERILPKKLKIKKIKRKVKYKRVKKVPKIKYTKKKELKYTYTNKHNSLWQDCKKCFIPVYEEEDDSSYQKYIKPRAIKIKQEEVQPRKEIRVEIPELKTIKESFWKENKKIKKKKRVRRRRRTNKFHIDEQFLP